MDDGANVKLDHELITGNQCGGRGGAGIWVDGFSNEIGSTCTLSHCTVADNSCVSGCNLGGSGLLVEYYSVASVENSIFWGNGGDDLNTDETSQLTVTYTNAEEAFSGTGNLFTNPFFAGAANADCHLQSKSARWDSATGAWVVDPNQSPCIDEGNPASVFVNEPSPNRTRVNMGVYGNTSEASKSLTGECPACSGAGVSIEGYTYQSGMDCECIAASSITLGPNVVVENGAKVRLKAPIVNFKGPVHVKPGADFKISQ